MAIAQAELFYRYSGMAAPVQLRCRSGDVAVAINEPAGDDSGAGAAQKEACFLASRKQPFAR